MAMTKSQRATTRHLPGPLSGLMLACSLVGAGCQPRHAAPPPPGPAAVSPPAPAPRASPPPPAPAVPPAPPAQPVVAPPRTDAAIDAAIDNEAQCLQFRDADTLIYTTGWAPEEHGHALDARTGEPAGEVAARECAPSRTADGAWILTADASAGSTALVELRDAVTGKRRLRFTPWRKRVFEYDSGYHLVARLLPDGDRIALLLAEDIHPGATLSLWSLRKRRILRELPMSMQPDREPRLIAPRLGEALAISVDGRFVAAGNHDSAVHVFDLAADGKELVLPTDLAIVTAVALSRDGRWLAATGQGLGRTGSVTTFELPSGRRLGSAPAPAECSVVAISPDGERVAVGCKSDLYGPSGLPAYPAPRGIRIFPAAQLGR